MSKPVPWQLQIKTYDGKSIALVGKPGVDALYLALGDEDSDFVEGSPALATWLEKAAKRLRKALKRKRARR
jgi:hypothetical protein